jgi:hypothetical protein
MGNIVSATKIGAREEPQQQEKSNYIFGQPTPHKHYLYEEREERNRGWLRNCGAWERLHGSGRW